MGRNVFISGSGNVAENVENFSAINCHEQVYSQEDSGKTILNNGAVVVTEDEILFTKPITGDHTYVTKTADFITGKDYRTYFVDCTSGNVDVTLEYDGIDYTIIKIDSSINVVNILPSVGSINGAGSDTISTQYGRRVLIFDGSNWYR